MPSWISRYYMSMVCDTGTPSMSSYEICPFVHQCYHTNSRVRPLTDVRTQFPQFPTWIYISNHWVKASLAHRIRNPRPSEARHIQGPAFHGVPHLGPSTCPRLGPVHKQTTFPGKMGPARVLKRNTHICIPRHICGNLLFTRPHKLRHNAPGCKDWGWPNYKGFLNVSPPKFGHGVFH